MLRRCVGVPVTRRAALLARHACTIRRHRLLHTTATSLLPSVPPRSYAHADEHNSNSSSSSSTTTAATASSSAARRQRRHNNSSNSNNNAAATTMHKDDVDADTRAAAEAEFGVMQNIHIKAYPVRAAIDIGSAGHISLCVARVDAAKAAVHQLLYQTQLPLHLESTVPLQNTTAAAAAAAGEDNNKSSSSSGASSSLSSAFAGGVYGDEAVFAQPFTLSERTVLDLRNKMRVMHGVLRRDSLRGVSECAAVLSWPLCLAANAGEVAAALSREFGMAVRVLGADFVVQLPWRCQDDDDGGATTRSNDSSSSSNNSREDDGDGDEDEVATLASARRDGGGNSSHHRRHSDDGEENGLKALLARTAAARQRRRRERRLQQQRRQQAMHSDSDAVAMQRVRRLRDSVLHLAFLAHAALAECVVPQRMLVVHDDPQRGLSIVAAATTVAEDTADLLERAGDDDDERTRILRACGMHDGDVASSSSSSSTIRSDGEVVCVHDAAASVTALHEHRLPADVAAAHRLCIVDVQHRHASLYSAQHSSPNPMLASEYAALCEVLAGVLTPTLPSWLRRKAALGGVVVGTSYNGGLLNIAARVAQRAPIARSHLDVHAAHHFAALTDVLLAETFPCARVVLPAAALTSALMHALATPRIAYVPELTTAAALLLQPSLWVYDQRAHVRQRLRSDAFHSSPRQRSFARPRIREQPTAAPHAVLQRAAAPPWDSTDYGNSLAGTL